MFLKSVVNLEGLPDDERPHVALAGRSNVGKSSLVNALSGKANLARVSAEPGRTQALNFYDIDPAYYLVDMPGYGFARGQKGKRAELTRLITDYLQRAAQVKLVAVVIDSRIGPTDLDRTMLAFLEKAKLPRVILASKVDKLSNAKFAEMKRTLAKEYPDVPQYYHSTASSKYRGEIRRVFALAAKSGK